MTIRPELNKTMFREATLELLNPVLHRVEVPEIENNPELKKRLLEVQQAQAAYFLSARQYATGKLKMPYFFEKAKGPLYQKWIKFAELASPEFVEATNKRKNVRETAYEKTADNEKKILDFVYSHGCPYTEYEKLPPKIQNIYDMKVTANKELYKGSVALFPRNKQVPFPIHYAITAKRINSELGRADLIAKFLQAEYPETFEALDDVTPEENIQGTADSYFSPVGFFSEGHIGKRSDAGTRNVLLGKQIQQLPIIEAEKISPDNFPYQETHFKDEHGALPSGVTNLNELIDWYASEISRIADIARKLE
jgi:hypothetical protein